MADPISVAFLNESTLITDAEIEAIVAANQEDVGVNGPLWGLPPVTLRQIPKGNPPPSGYRQQVFLDNADVAGALGYHQRTIEGLSLGKTFVATTLLYKQTTSRVNNHELWEDLVDENMDRVTAAMAGRVYAVEVGDLLSLDSQGRQGLGGVLLSGIALPAAYYAGYGTRYDIGGILTAPLPNIAPATGAYLMWQDGGAAWAGQTAPSVDPNEFMHQQAQHGSRRHRRIIGAAHWRRSTVAVR